jgi:hypothetical protein
MFHRLGRERHRAARWHGPGAPAWWLALGVVLGSALGCGTTRVTNTQRAATEQLLVSSAIDQAVAQLDFRVLAGKPVYFDAQYLGAGADQGYVVSSLRQHLLACGCLLHEDRARATYVVEARSGGIGTDVHQLLFGVPQMNVPSVLPGQPSLIPEMPFAKKTDQKGVAKLAVFAYNRRTGRPVWQSGVVQAASTSKDTWLLGAGPFRQGTLGEATKFAGQQINIPLLSGKDSGQEAAAPVMAVTGPAVWEETPAPPLVPDPLSAAAAAPKMGPVGTAKLGTPATPVARSVEFVNPSGPERKTAAGPDKGGGEPGSVLYMQAIVIPGYRPAGAGESARNGVGTTAGQPQGKDVGARTVTSSPGAGTDQAK